jgi:hypothetical protein
VPESGKRKAPSSSSGGKKKSKSDKSAKELTGVERGPYALLCHATGTHVAQPGNGATADKGFNLVSVKGESTIYQENPDVLLGVSRWGDESDTTWRLWFRKAEQREVKYSTLKAWDDCNVVEYSTGKRTVWLPMGGAGTNEKALKKRVRTHRKDSSKLYNAICKNFNDVNLGRVNQEIRAWANKCGVTDGAFSADELAAADEALLTARKLIRPDGGLTAEGDRAADLGQQEFDASCAEFEGCLHLSKGRPAKQQAGLKLRRSGAK